MKITGILNIHGGPAFTELPIQMPLNRIPNQQLVMDSATITRPGIRILPHKTATAQRIQSIDLLRGIVMIIMALDHVRDYFHNKAFVYNPEDLAHTSAVIFFTRWITHFCAPVFVLLAGISAYLYGVKRGRKALSFFLVSRGLWLVAAEMFIVTLGWTFNPSYPFFNLQVIWATGISMILLAAIIYMNSWFILITGIAFIAGHNLLDGIHVPGAGPAAFLWSLLHEPGYYTFGHFSFSVRYPVLPWIGIMAVGYSLGRLYTPGYDRGKRKKILLLSGIAAILFFIILRLNNWYGDAALWSLQKNMLFSLLSFLNVSKYPPSLLYILMTLGPALIFLSLAEKPMNTWFSKITILGRVPMFYYVLHIFLIHLLAVICAVIIGYQWQDMILSVRVNKSPQLNKYGFNLITVYLIWLNVILLLYPLCKWFANYKRTHQNSKWWLGYL